MEPIVELARARTVEGPDAAAAKTNSPRLVAFAEGADGVVWAADLRQRAWIPKLNLPLQPDLTQPIARDRARKHFRLRLGGRYWRDPVPDDLVNALQRPLRDAVKGSTSRISKLRNFLMWLGLRTDGEQALVIAVASDDRRAEAEADWLELMSHLESSKPDAHALIEPHESGVYSVSEVSLDLWLRSFKFDFDEVTYSRRADDGHAEPAR